MKRCTTGLARLSQGVTSRQYNELEKENIIKKNVKRNEINPYIPGWAELLGKSEEAFYNYFQPSVVDSFVI